MAYVVAYLATAIVFLGLDYLWLSNAGPRIYQPALGDLMLDRPNIPVAAAFYLVYAAGIVVFAIAPHGEPRSLGHVSLLGAFLGLVAYGTYDITNLATLRGWPVSIALIDMAWGVFVTAMGALGGALALRAWTG